MIKVRIKSVGSNEFLSKSFWPNIAENFLASLALIKTNKESCLTSDITSRPDGPANYTPCFN